jgi:hypothetical protein
MRIPVTSRRKAPTNVSVRADLVRQARLLKLNLSELLVSTRRSRSAASSATTGSGSDGLMHGAQGGVQVFAAAGRHTFELPVVH